MAWQTQSFGIFCCLPRYMNWCNRIFFKIMRIITNYHLQQHAEKLGKLKVMDNIHNLSKLNTHFKNWIDQEQNGKNGSAIKNLLCKMYHRNIWIHNWILQTFKGIKINYLKLLQNIERNGNIAIFSVRATLFWCQRHKHTQHTQTLNQFLQGT